jgi:ATP-dependent helicase HepA
MSNKETPVPGQRWVSDTEPELGLGIVLKCEFGRAEIYFPAAGEHRQYALGSAPVRRVRFQEGDSIKTHSGESLVVDSIEDVSGLLVYKSGSRIVKEAELSDLISFSKPDDRLLAGQVDEIARFDLRVECLNRRRALRQSPIRGFAGGRVDLIPHQISIAAEVATRLVPRVLLADEVGLGKTIEAGLILQRLHLTGRASRILVILPPALLNQWFVEMFRRFQMTFSIFDEERCISLEADGSNPFLDSQLVLCGLDFLAEHPKRVQQAQEAGWDLLVVDEAHHLRWTPDKPSLEYQLVETLAASTPSLLLLTATPQQLGMEGHFARLRLLDPDRFSDLDTFLKESERYEKVAKVIDTLLEGKKISDTAFLNGPHMSEDLSAYKAGDVSARDRLVSMLLDEHGTGRVMFRNTRAALTGFPKRKAHLVELEANSDFDPAQEIRLKIEWLIRLLKDLKKQKILLICKTKELAEQVLARLQSEIKISAAIFHEGLTLLQRDRNAAFFGDEDGARLLICSEIGSEGRNFQFAHHLVLFDIPVDPDLLEQRIGRLDRIGQTSTIHIHVPYYPKTQAAVLSRWYHEALNAFEKNLHGAGEIMAKFRNRIEKLSANFSELELEKIITQSAAEKKKIGKRLQGGHDRLLELNSSRPQVANPIIDAIRRQDDDAEFEAFFIRVLDHLNVHVEELGLRSYLLKSGSSTTATLPGLNPEGCMVTFDRARAIAREDIGFITPDHPLVRAALDAVLSMETGNSVFGVWKSEEPNAVFLEVHSVIECIAPPALHIDRFLPATPVRVVVDQGLNDCSTDKEFRNARLEKGDVFSLLDTPVFKKKHLPSMVAKAHSITSKLKSDIVETAQNHAAEQLDREIARLQDLGAINPHVRPSEIEALKKLKSDIHTALGESVVRADALKLVLRVNP